MKKHRYTNMYSTFQIYSDNTTGDITINENEKGNSRQYLEPSTDVYDTIEISWVPDHEEIQKLNPPNNDYMIPSDIKKPNELKILNQDGEPKHQLSDWRSNLTKYRRFFIIFSIVIVAFLIIVIAAIISALYKFDLIKKGKTLFNKAGYQTYIHLLCKVIFFL